ncbi:lactonase family protein [Nonlabens antarcticus]|uniref:hypothetical protein n=1 Tax=Nonlabens antarcticus TaxID=392714 RepID=UPI001891CF7A|nr:hypothetical protein [Nonlabens antarcticus]
MKKSILSLFCGIAIVLATSCSNNDDYNDNNSNTVAGYLYTTTNGQSTNQVIRFDRMDNGMLANETAYITNSLGGSNVSVGGDAHGDFDAQGAIKIIDNYLLNVNAGGNTVSVFSLDKSNGDLSLIGNTDSGGTRPVSITSTPVSGSTTEFWVMVGNQWNNPNVQKNAPNVERYPNDAFHAMDLTQPDASDAERNIALFRFNTADGSLNFQGVMDNFVRENGGPVEVLFSEDGSKLAVSLWGIAHFLNDGPSLEEQHPSRVYIYDFSNGVVSNPRFFEEEGIAGTIGISWAPNSNTTLYSTNFNVTAAKAENSMVVLTDTGSAVNKMANFNTGNGSDLDEACWTVVSPTGDRLYVSSFKGNIVTPFSIGSGGSITGTLPFETRKGVMPPGDSKDVYVTADNRFLYNTGAFQSFSMNIFDVTNGGLEFRQQIFLDNTQSGSGQPGAFNFLGLTGFDL